MVGVMSLQTKEEQAYLELRKLILEGKLPKQEFLSQRRLASQINANINTTRSALRLLENDNLIENVPQWGVRIPIETEEIIRDRYFMRELIEAGAVKLIMDRIRTESLDISPIIEKAILCDTISREEPISIIKFADAHFDFHMELARYSKSNLILKNLERLHFHSLIKSHAERGWAGTTTDHKLLVDLMLKGNENEAKDAMIKHIRAGLNSELKYLQKK
ncbi:MAG: GntR family transcriptional regulator [Sphaerochaetaceae bacterium]